jgi:hypothetical protein
VDSAARFSARRIAITVSLIALVLCALSLIFTAYEWSLGTENTYWVLQLTEFFNVSHEANLPSWFSTMLLMSVALLSALIARLGQKSRRYWAAFSILFLYLSLDEAAVIHEMLTTPLREALQLGGFLYFSWLLVGIPFAIVVGLLLLPFLRSLPAPTLRLMLLAALLYLGGAALIEAISAAVWDANNGTSLLYSAISTLEEFLEMQGVILLIYSLMRYLNQNIPVAQLQFGP